MIQGAVFAVEQNRCLLPQVWKTDTALGRMRGLLGRAKLLAGEGLLIESCSMVRTVGMTYALDLVFLDAGGGVCKLVNGLQPFRWSGSLNAKRTLELPTGTLELICLRLGDQLHWRAATK